jgi:DNA-binding response OmpR family regulator
MTDPQATTLLIDDDPILLELLSDHLQTAGYRSLTARNGTVGLRLAAEALPDLVVVDVMMPGMSGWEVCETLRAKSLVPIIMLTAKDGEIDKLRGFRLGIDDYVTKPFSFAELTARISALLARAQGAPQVLHGIRSGDLTIDFGQRSVTLDDRAVDLTVTEYRLLETLARCAKRTVPVETVIAEVWGPEYAGTVEQVRHYIWALRHKIESDPSNPLHLLTDRGFGYRFE